MNVNLFKLIYILWSFFFYVNILKSVIKFVRVFKFFLLMWICMCFFVDGLESFIIEVIMFRVMLYMLRVWYIVILGVFDIII